MGHRIVGRFRSTRAATSPQEATESMRITRREALGTVVAGGTGALWTRNGVLGAAEPRPGDRKVTVFHPGQHSPRKLPFDVKKLRGLSEKLVHSHWENNYGAAVKNLNLVEEELARVGQDAPGFLFGALKERELTFTNSMILHELYFGNLGGDGKPGGAISSALAETYGTVGQWEAIFHATGASLGGGSGWAMLVWNLHDGGLRTYWSGNHTQVAATSLPLLVMDMYEHAYQMDFGAAAAKYLDAFMQNVDWQEVNRRFEHAMRLARS
jgi:superoxide dismutase, Fe-Mn family